MTAPTILFNEDWFGYSNVDGNIDVPENDVFFLFVSASDDTTDYYDLVFDLLGDDTQWFELVDGSLGFNPEPDYEFPSDADFDNTYELTIRVTDLDGYYTEENIYIHVQDVDDDPNNAPEFVSDTLVEVPENSEVAVYIAEADDPDGDTVTYEITGGADQYLFSIDPETGEVYFNDVLDYENPQDADGNNSYEIEITASDSYSETDPHSVLIQVTDLDDTAPVLDGDVNFSIEENTAEVPYAVVAYDPEDGDITYDLEGPDGHLFQLGPNGELSFFNAPDFEAPGDADSDNVYEIYVVATDEAGNESAMQTVTVTVEDLSDSAPIITSTEDMAEFLENSFDTIYTVEAMDADVNDTVTFRFSDDSPDASYFMIDEHSGAILPIMPFNHEDPQDGDGDNVYELAIIASDGVNDSDPFSLFVTVIGENDNVPVMLEETAEVTVPENIDGTIYTAVASDDDTDGEPLRYILGGADAHLFYLDPDTGELSFPAPPDFENPLDDGSDNIYDVEITASDGDNISDALAITIEITDETEGEASPSITSPASASVAENTTGTVYTAQADDPDSVNVTFIISGGGDAGLFAIEATTGELSFLTAPDFETPSDIDTDNIYEVEITASDGANDSNAFAVSITVTNENDHFPVMDAAVAAVTAPENASGTVYTAAASDNDGDPLQYILGGADAHLFYLNPNSGELWFLAAPDFEVPDDEGGDNRYDVEISATDGQSISASTAVSITVDDVNEDPNLINGTPNTDNLIGTDGNDVIVGLASNDIMDGSLGSDTLDGGLGGDTITGGQGSDTVSYKTSSSGMIIDLDVQLTWDGSVNDVLSSIENAVGSALNDHLWGSSGDNVLDGGSGGSDDISGHAGSDTVSYASSGSGVIIDLSAQLTWDGSVNDVLLSIENAVGSAFNDHLWGSSGDNVLDGGAGGSDDIRGYGGNDTVSYASSSSVAIIDLTAQLTWDGSANDALSSIENAIGSRFHDDIWGNSGDNVLDGGLGRDVLFGYDGNDTFVFHRGEASGDAVADFDGKGATAGDRLEFFGYGTAAEGATFTQLDATHWSINSADGLVHDIMTLRNGATIHSSDFLFH